MSMYDGEPMVSSMLYVTFSSIIEIFNPSIVQNTPEYKKAVWGEPLLGNKNLGLPQL